MSSARQLSITYALFMVDPLPYNYVPTIADPRQRFIEFIFSLDLNDSKLTEIIKSLEWNEPEFDNLLIEQFLQPWKIKLGKIEQLAQCVAGLRSVYPNFVQQIVDATCELCISGLDVSLLSF